MQKISIGGSRVRSQILIYYVQSQFFENSLFSFYPHASDVQDLRVQLIERIQIRGTGQSRRTELTSGWRRVNRLTHRSSSLRSTTRTRRSTAYYWKTKEYSAHESTK